MAAKLQCEICGGKLVGMPGGVFECEACGTEYSTAWAKAKIQEITGTVKVEGTVEVTGKVQVDGPVKVEGGVNKEALLQRGNLSLEDSQWDKAKEFFDQALSLDAEYADAWLGLALAERRIKKESDLANPELYRQGVEENDNYKKFLRFASPERSREIIARMDAAEEKAENLKNADAAAREAFRQKLPALRARIAPAQGMVLTEIEHTAALREDGTVLAAGKNEYGDCDVSDWRDIVQIAVAYNRTVGLKADGSVVAAGLNNEGQCDVSDWKDMIAIAAGYRHTVGLRADGTVAAVGENKHGIYQNGGFQPIWDGRCNKVSKWENIVAIAAGHYHTVGLKADGTVVAVGRNDDRQCDVSEWKDVVAIAAGSDFTVGLKADGSLLSTKADYMDRKNAAVLTPTVSSNILVLRDDGTVSAPITNSLDKNKYGQLNVSDWREIVALSMDWYTMGLKADGTVIGAGTQSYGKKWNKKTCDWDLSAWENIVAISVGSDHAVGLKEDGTLVYAGYHEKIGDLRGWKLFESLDTLQAERGKLIERGKAVRAKAEAERKAAAEKAETVRKTKIAVLEAEQTGLNEEMKKLTGLFTGKRRKEIETRLAEIENELKRLS